MDTFTWDFSPHVVINPQRGIAVYTGEGKVFVRVQSPEPTKHDAVVSFPLEQAGAVAEAINDAAEGCLARDAVSYRNEDETR